MLGARSRSRRPAAVPAASGPPASGAWLYSPRADFWVVAGGGGVLLVVLALVLQWRGDRELSAADVLLGELHLGATYGAIVRRRLWRRMPLDVLAIPLAILAATYLLMGNGPSLLVTTAVLCLGAWHRGRQNLGIALHYHRRAGGPASPLHHWLLRAAFYLPMAAAVAYYASTAPTHEGDEFHNLSLGPALLWGLGSAAAIGVLAYLIWTVGRTASPDERATAGVHPCERWLVLANAVGFASAYVLGAWTSSFVLVLALHHEVQYLCFTYAAARRAEALGQAPAAEARRLVRFALWPAIGLTSWAFCWWADLAALDPFLTAGLLGHYWLDGRIWTGRARRLGAVGD